MTPCLHPDRALVTTMDDFSNLHIRCEECGALVFVRKAERAEVNYYQQQQIEADWRRRNPGVRRPLR